ncbi:MAG TPA: DUF2807 domain-containing protein [Anaerolineae bacterium]|nr:DUF2807 domain-containing protein [Anaerolineae bacterium]
MAKVVKETRDVGEFEHITMKGFGKLILKQGPKQELIIEADDYTMSRISTDVINGELIIDVGRDWVEKISAGLDFLSTREIVINITVKKLSMIEISGGCKIEAKGIKTESLDLKLTGASSVEFSDLTADQLNTDMPGAGKIVISGKVKEQQVNLTGAGNFSGGKLKSKNTKVNLTGVGSATVWATDKLDVTITGVGSVDYYGEPEIKQSIAILGTIKSLGQP